MKAKCALLTVMLAGGLGAQGLIGNPEGASRTKPTWKLWSISVAEMMSGAAFDAWSSRRLNPLVDQGAVHETNGLFADSQGHYVSSRAIPIECGTYAAVAIGEYFILRRAPKLARAFAYVNFGLSGIGVTAGIRNMALYSKLAKP